MIQRRQSLYLLFAALCLGSALLLPFTTYLRTSLERSYTLSAHGLFNQEGSPLLDVGMNFPFALVLGVMIAVTVVSIFLFKDQARQLRIVRSVMVVCLVVVAFQMITHFNFLSYLERDGEVLASIRVGMFMPAAALILFWAASRGIAKDKALLRSLDSLR